MTLSGNTPDAAPHTPRTLYFDRTAMEKKAPHRGALRRRKLPAARLSSSVLFPSADRADPAAPDAAGGARRSITSASIRPG